MSSVRALSSLSLQDFRESDWTYPDYRAPPLMRFLEKARRKYLTDAAAAGSSASMLSPYEEPQ